MQIPLAAAGGVNRYGHQRGAETTWPGQWAGRAPLGLALLRGVQLFVVPPSIQHTPCCCSPNPQPVVWLWEESEQSSGSSREWAAFMQRAGTRPFITRLRGVQEPHQGQWEAGRECPSLTLVRVGQWASEWGAALVSQPLPLALAGSQISQHKPVRILPGFLQDGGPFSPNGWDVGWSFRWSVSSCLVQTHLVSGTRV